MWTWGAGVRERVSLAILAVFWRSDQRNSSDPLRLQEGFVKKSGCYFPLYVLHKMKFLCHCDESVVFTIISVELMYLLRGSEGHNLSHAITNESAVSSYVGRIIS